MVEKDRLAELLEEAAEAHHDYEQELGEEDPDWAEWYAEFIVERL